MAVAQTTPDDGRPDVIVVDIWDASTPATDFSEAAGPALSREFAVAALRALTSMREWQQHLATTIRTSFPLSECRIADDRDKAADSLRLAALAASTEPDRTALRELAVNYDDVSRWSAEMVETNRNLDMAKYYVSPTSLDDDELYQKAATCENFLAPMFVSLRLAEDSACR